MFNPFKKRYSDEELKLFLFLNNIKHFEFLNEEELSQLIPYMYERSYMQDEVVFFRDDPSYALYIVKKGAVSLNIDMNNKFEVLTAMSKGETFGDNTLLENSKRIYSAIVTSERADLYVIPQINLLEIMASHPAIRAKIMTSFAELYNDYTSNLFNIYKSSFGFFELGSVYDKTE
jgi:CRP/FNR family cyclic AMP-dependent transcriptional regulator